MDHPLHPSDGRYLVLNVALPEEVGVEVEEPGNGAGPVDNEVLEPGAGVALVEERGQHDLQQEQLQGELTDGRIAAKYIQTHPMYMYVLGKCWYSETQS